jgi:hypothetical protein
MPPRTLSETEYNTIRDKVMASLPDNLSEDDFQRVIGPAMAQAVGEAENTPPMGFGWVAPPSFDAAKRFVGGAASVLNPLNLVSAVVHPVQTVENIGTGVADQAAKAKEAFQQGRYVEAAGHAAAMVPVIGPAAAHAGERIGQGDVAGGLGEGLGLLAPFGARYGLEARAAANPTAAAITERAAADQVAQQVLGPGNPAYKGVAQRIAPEVLARGLTGSREALRQTAVDGMADAAQRIDAGVQAAGGLQAPLPVQTVLGELRARIAQLQDSKGMPLSDQAAARIAALQKRIVQVQNMGGRTGLATYEDLKALRDENYRIADEAKAYQGRNLPIEDEGWAAQQSGNAIMNVFARRSPQTAAANADYAFFKSLNDVLDPVQGRPKATTLPSGVTGGARTAGAAAGQLTGIPGAAFVMSTVVPWLKEQMASPQWQLASAAKKMELAEALRRGDIGRMQAAMSRFGQATALATSPSGSQTQTTAPLVPAPQ